MTISNIIEYWWDENEDDVLHFKTSTGEIITCKDVWVKDISFGDLDYKFSDDISIESSIRYNSNNE